MEIYLLFMSFMVLIILLEITFRVSYQSLDASICSSVSIFCCAYYTMQAIIKKTHYTSCLQNPSSVGKHCKIPGIIILPECKLENQIKIIKIPYENFMMVASSASSRLRFAVSHCTKM